MSTRRVLRSRRTVIAWRGARLLGVVAALTATLLVQPAEAALPADAADLEISITESADPIVVGDALTYFVTVTNHGPSSVAQPVVEMRGTERELIRSVVGGSCDYVGCTLPSLRKHGVATITVRMKPPLAGTSFKYAAVSSALSDPVAENNVDGEETTVLGPDLVVSLRTVPERVVAGQPFTLEMTVTNRGATAAPDTRMSIDVFAPQAGSLVHLDTRAKSGAALCTYSESLDSGYFYPTGNYGYFSSCSWNIPFASSVTMQVSFQPLYASQSVQDYSVLTEASSSWGDMNSADNDLHSDYLTVEVM